MKKKNRQKKILTGFIIYDFNEINPYSIQDPHIIIVASTEEKLMKKLEGHSVGSPEENKIEVPIGVARKIDPRGYPANRDNVRRSANFCFKEIPIITKV